MKIHYSDKTVTYPDGFYAAATCAHLQDDSPDMALIYSEKPCNCAIVMTTNQVKAAPVLWDSEIKDIGDKRAVIVNTASANACTGELGYENARASAEIVAAEMGLKPEEVFVSSTGVIGIQLNMDKISEGIVRLCKTVESTDQAGYAAAEAILTTDTKIKSASAEFEVDGKKIKIGGICKGAGMIRPNMATMLSFVTTDAAIEKNVLEDALSQIVEDTYNMISVDGDMSTNDTAIVLANGCAGNKTITSLDSKMGRTFLDALMEVETRLANQIVKDAEGSTKLIEVRVTGADSRKDARTLARSVAESTLVKTALFGCDPNWGRIICALGYADAPFDQNKTRLNISNGEKEMTLFKDGAPMEYDEDQAVKLLQGDEIIIDIDLGEGEEQAIAWGCDLTYDYVKINGEYRT